VLQVVFIDVEPGALNASHSHPDLQDALAAVAQLTTSNGKPLHVELLSREHDLGDPKTYQAGLRRVSRRARLQDAVLISDDAERARAARAVQGLTALHFERHDWAELPLVIAAREERASQANLEVALKSYLHARHDLELASVEPGPTAQQIAFRATAWRPIEDDGLGEASGVLAPFPVEGVVSRDSGGRVDAVKVPEPSVEARSEARNLVASLVHHGQLESHAKGQRARGTHHIIVDAKGRRRLVRSRVSYR
jgi:hypothetical protein